MIKRLSLTFLILITLLVFVNATANASADKSNKYKAKSALQTSENISELSFTPKVKAQLIDPQGNVTELNYSSKHKLVGVTKENGKDVYHVESTVDVPIVATATGSGSLDKSGQTDTGTLHQRARLYWNYITEADGRTYVKYTQINAYWYRDDRNYTAYPARYSAYISGTQLGDGSYYKGYESPDFYPYWTPTSQYLQTTTYTNTTGDFVNWPYVQPLDDFGVSQGGVKGHTYYLASDLGWIYTMVQPK